LKKKNEVAQCNVIEDICNSKMKVKTATETCPQHKDEIVTHFTLAKGFLLPPPSSVPGMGGILLQNIATCESISGYNLGDHTHSQKSVS
jgi:hypothetical protein